MLQQKEYPEDLIRKAEQEQQQQEKFCSKTIL
jgi:hypothetical protein